MNSDAALRIRTIRPDEDVSHLPVFDNTKLNAIATCPMWGIIRYGLHRTMGAPTNPRTGALAAGSALHMVFAARRLFDLYIREETQGHALYHATTTLENRELADALTHYSPTPEEAFEYGRLALDLADYEEDPDDTRRSRNNLEEAAMLWLRHYDMRRTPPVWVANLDDPSSMIGVELPFQLVIEINDVPLCVFTGKIDGLHQGTKTTVALYDGKTSSTRMDLDWQMKWDLDTQVTGYTLAASMITGIPIRDAVIEGVAIPPPSASSKSDPCVDVPTYREPQHYVMWRRWLLEQVQVYNDYIEQPLVAPTRPHSCYRFFKTCPLLMFCYSTGSVKEQMFADLEYDEWSPLQHGGR